MSVVHTIAGNQKRGVVKVVLEICSTSLKIVFCVESRECPVQTLPSKLTDCLISQRFYMIVSDGTGEERKDTHFAITEKILIISAPQLLSSTVNYTARYLCPLRF